MTHDELQKSVEQLVAEHNKLCDTDISYASETALTISPFIEELEVLIKKPQPDYVLMSPATIIEKDLEKISTYLFTSEDEVAKTFSKGSKKTFSWPARQVVTIPAGTKMKLISKENETSLSLYQVFTLQQPCTFETPVQYRVEKK